MDDFILTLKTHRIDLLVDVRSRPYSQRFPDYNKEYLEQMLKRNEIYYRNYSSEFGARQEDRKYLSTDGRLDFELFRNSPQFMEGYNKVCTGMKKGYRAALMCAEKDPFNCHRSILVAKAFHDSGFEVVHLLPGNITMSQKDIEKRLLEKYQKEDINQCSIFGELRDENEYIAQAYRKHNETIGYSIEEEFK